MDTKSERLRHFAKAHSGKLNAFAEELEIAASQLQNYITGERFPKDDILEKIARLGCNLHWLVTGEGEMFADNEAGRALRAKHANPTAEQQEQQKPQPALVEITITEQDKKLLNSVVIDMNDAEALERVLEKIKAARAL